MVEGLRLGFHPEREPAAAVEGARLDSVPSRHGLPSADFLKPDTEGSELEILAAARAHWGIEIRLHRIHDMVFHDDLCRLRNGFGPQNFAVIQHTALKLLKQAKTKQIIASKAHARWPPGQTTPSKTSFEEHHESFNRFPYMNGAAQEPSPAEVASAITSCRPAEAQ